MRTQNRDKQSVTQWNIWLHRLGFKHRSRAYWAPTLPIANIDHSQVKEKSYHSSFYFWTICGSDVKLPAVLTNKRSVYLRFGESERFVYLRRHISKPSLGADWSNSVLFFAHRLVLTILHSTVWVLCWMSTSQKEYFTEEVLHWMSTSLKEYFT